MARAIGLDIGADAVKAALLERKGDSLRVLRLLSIDWQDLAERDVEPGDEVGLALVVQRLFREAGWKSADICLGLAGRQSMLRFLHLPIVPSWRLKLIMKYEIQQVAEQAGEELSADYRLVNVPAPEEEENLVLIGMARDREINDRLQAYSKLGLPIHAVLPAGMAVFNAGALLNELLLEPDETSLFLEVGRENTELVVGHFRDFVFTRTLPWGMNQVVAAIASKRQISEADALQKLMRAGGALGEVRGPLSKLVQMIKDAFPYCKKQTKWPSMKPAQIIISGGGAAFAPLRDLLHEQLGLDVTRLDLPEVLDTELLDVDGKELLDARPDCFSVALGLAATRLDAKAFQLDLLPNEYKKKRTFRTQTVFLIAAAVVLLLYLGFGLIDSYLGLSKARAEHSELRKKRTRIVAMEDENERQRLANLERWQLLESLSERSDLGYFNLRLMLICGDRLPDKIKLEALSMVKPEKDSDVLSLSIEGESDNRDGRGFDRIETFKKGLEEEEEIAAVEDREAVANAERSTVAFKLIVKPRRRE